MKDCILYVPSFSELVTHLRKFYPDLLDEEGGTEAPVVTGFSRTPAVVSGDELMVYARVRPNEEALWSEVEGVSIWGLTDYVGQGTAQTVYDAVFNDPEKKAIYDRIYPHEPYEVDDPDFGTYTITPAPWFGIMAGA